MNKRQIFYTLFLMIAAAVLPVAAQNQVDLSFNAVPSQAVTAGNLKGQVVQSDGKVIVWGGSMTVDGLPKGTIARLNTDGSADNSFSYCECGITSITNIMLQADNKLLVAGSFGGQPKMVRVNTDGSLDASYNPPFAPVQGGTGGVRVWAVQADGKSLAERTSYVSIAGSFITRTIIRVNTDGTIDGGFTNIIAATGQGNVNLTQLVVAPDGKIYLGRNAGTISQGTISRFNSDGTSDSSWSPPNITLGSFSSTRVDGIDVHADGSLVVAGLFDAINGVGRNRVAKLGTAGNVDLGFSTVFFSEGGQVKALPDGKTMISAATALGNPFKFYRINANGSLDAGFNMDPSVTSILNRWATDPSGNPVFFGTVNNGPHQLYRLTSTGALDSGFNANIGEFGKINVIARQADGKFIVSGTFIMMNSVARNNIARINADGTLDPTFDPGTGFSFPPTSLTIQPDGKILAGGTFTTYNGASQAKLARINSDGSLDTAFAPVFNTGMNAVALQPDGKIVVAGSFTSVNSVTRTGLARLNADGTLDSLNVIIGGSGNLTAVVAEPDGKITFTGSFNGVNGFSRTGMARLLADGNLDVPFTPSGSGWRGIVRQPDGKYIVFSNSAVSRKNADGTVDATFTPPAFSHTNSDVMRINSVLLQADGSLVVGGSFNRVGGFVRNNLARLSSTGKFDGLFFQAGANIEVRSVIADTGAKIMLGGDFTSVENISRAGIARLSTAPFHLSTPFDFDGDGRADIGVFRATTGDWYMMQSAGGLNIQNFGTAGDQLTPADFDGDGKTDLAIYRSSTATFWYKSSVNGGFYATGIGINGDTALPSDFDGDGKADLVTYRPTDGYWTRQSTGTGHFSSFYFGAAGDIPVVADMDGDGKTDATIFRPSTGYWWYSSSINGNQVPVLWGANGDVPVAADYDADGKTDFAVFRPSNGAWYILNSSTGTPTILVFGQAGDKPVAADYDGDGKADVGVYRPSNGVWYVLQTTAGFTGMQFGISTDRAIANAFVQ